MVMAVAVIEKSREAELLELGVKDSKLLSEKERNRQLPEIKKIAREFASVHISPKELDMHMARYSLNEIEAMKAAHLLNMLKEKPEVVYIDSPDTVQSNFAVRIKRYLDFDAILRAEHRADMNYPVVSAASVIAKVERDREIAKLAKKHGEIGSGYSHDEVTIKFIERHLKEHGKLPDFVRKAWETNKRLLNERLQTKLV